MNNLIQRVIEWAENSNLINPSDIQPETLMLVARFGRLSQVITKGKNCREEIGNCLINLIIICKMRGISLADCLDHPLKENDERLNDSLFIMAVILSSLGRITEDISKNKEYKEEVCNLLTYLAILTAIPNLSLLDCLEHSFGLIKHKKTIKFNGVILVETDEDYPTALQMMQQRKDSDEN